MNKTKIIIYVTGFSFMFTTEGFAGDTQNQQKEIYIVKQNGEKTLYGNTTDSVIEVVEKISGSLKSPKKQTKGGDK